jgi:hypothetical protein
MTDMPVKIVVNCSTGESTTIPLTAEEIAERDADLLAWKAEEDNRLAAEADKVKAQESAVAKLQALGLTAEEISAFKN